MWPLPNCGTTNKQHVFYLTFVPYLKQGNTLTANLCIFGSRSIVRSWKATPKLRVSTFFRDCGGERMDGFLALAARDFFESDVLEANSPAEFTTKRELRACSDTVCEGLARVANDVHPEHPSSGV